MGWRRVGSELELGRVDGKRVGWVGEREEKK